MEPAAILEENDRMRSVSLATVALLTMIGNSAAHAGGCAAEISAYRRAHGLSAVRADAALDRIAQQQAEAMARAGTVSHDVNGNFFVRIKPVHRRLAAENVAAGFLTCAETIRQWDASSGHRANLQMRGARRVGVASVAKPSSRYRRFWAMAITD
jgi:uncharacterized protein YkwD